MRIVVVEDNKLYRDELLQCLEQEESDIEGSSAIIRFNPFSIIRYIV